MTAPASQVVEFVMPFPPKELEPNRAPKSKAWRAKKTKDYREACMKVAEAAYQQPGWVVRRPPLTAPVKAEVTFVVRNRRRDRDNLLASVKAMFDGLVDARVLVGDHSDVFDPGTAILLVGQREEVRVVLRGAE